jgi:uncharacterized membrane protein
MNDLVTLSEKERGLKTIGHISYALHAVVAVATVLPGAQPSIVLLIVAFVLDLVKKDEAAGTWQAGHFAWRIRSVLWAFGLYVITSWLFLLFYFPGAIAWGLISLWFLYRVVRGWVNLNSNTPMPS